MTNWYNRNIKQNITEVLSKRFDEYVKEDGIVIFASQNFSESKETELAPLYDTQHALRPLWGKEGINQPNIGDHPDFLHLKDTQNKEYHPIVTMFLDIANSTRLALLYDLEDVHKIKNAIICLAIEIIHSFDGHVHRIMGDAVMAYFGGKTSTTENAIIDSVNCASVINFFFQKVVSSKINEMAGEDSPGIRIGLDYGAKDDVLWSSYGYPGANEVTATSFFVDVASKLQHRAGKNNIMIGQSLQSHIDFPKELLNIKTIQRNGDLIEQLYIKPNHTNSNGEPINYRQYILNWSEYLLSTNLGQISDNKLSDSNIQPLKISAEVYDTKDGNFIRQYCPASSANKKGEWIKFKVHLPYVPQRPCEMLFKVENHGSEASKKENNSNHQTRYNLEKTKAPKTIVHWESLSYRGLHYMIVVVKNRSGTKLKTRFGVYVE